MDILPQNKIIKFIDLINKKTSPYDDNGHGTFVSGIACGNGVFSQSHRGIAPLSNIISIKALSVSGDSNSNVILDAMQWVYENHKAYKIDVVCMSFGAEYGKNFDPLSQGAEALWKAGIVVVAAAGKKNNGDDDQPYPVVFKQIAEAVAKFEALVREQLARNEKIKSQKEFLDFDNLDKIVIGVCGGDGIGPIITKESANVLKFILKDDVDAGKIEFKYIIIY